MRFVIAAIAKRQLKRNQ